VQETVDRIISNLDRMDRDGSAGTFEAFSDEELIPALVTALNRTPPIRSDKARAWVYLQLAGRDAAQTEIGFDQLLQGLSDSAAASICAKALLNAPTERQDMAVEHIQAYLRTARQPAEPGLTVGPDLDGVLWAIARMGSTGSIYTGAIREILHDPSHPLKVRRDAAWALASVLPLSDAVARFEGLDEVGLEGVMGGLAEQMGELLEKWNAKGKRYSEFYTANRNAITAARALVCDALESPRPETQAAAFEPMMVVYGDDLFVIRSRDDYELNPELRPILEKIAVDHPDAFMRKRVVSLLDHQNQAQMVANILREGERGTHREDK
jgi:hypothetical protein